MLSRSRVDPADMSVRAAPSDRDAARGDGGAAAQERIASRRVAGHNVLFSGGNDEEISRNRGSAFRPQQAGTEAYRSQRDGLECHRGPR